MVIPFGFLLEPGLERIKPGLEKEFEFLDSVSDNLSSFSIPVNDSKVPLVVSQVADVVAFTWSLVARSSRVCICLKSWWPEDCAYTKCIALKMNIKSNWIVVTGLQARLSQHALLGPCSLLYKVAFIFTPHQVH